ncbi:1-acyl-sn-glycerol-3-phosphate acyltransferase [Maribellus sp. YY47]|uniref:1-acyl-sn-glycerol-3-phosphate acyltransferase n=1 Tax=Maribellus sp. YY47 TaxID=2929486 RepID=UPI002000C9DD|nr:1-acyl-sn-glycerol-3-phosphate acyltransferase [Maribellus sp. YY47]MCK3685904.1 1-acyl-sn-glycerol-3-phosphate acyltransferase [Maribellus sp. YY47]
MKYEKWSLGYYLLKQYVRFVDFIIHKKTIVNGKENLPKDAPIVFAPNHQNALSDPMAILLHTPYQPVWLGRADIFKNKIAAFLLRFLKIMPVYRLRDGKEQLAKNDKTFADSIRVLENHVPLALFPEAAHSGKRQMLAHKKAVPRIVFLAEEKAGHNLNIHIVPTGIYYSSYWKFNRTVIVNLGAPVRVNDFLEEYAENPNNATQLLKDALYNAIEPLTLNIKSKAHYEDFENIREIYGREFLRRQNKPYSPTNLFHSDQKLVGQLDEWENRSTETTNELATLAHQYLDSLKKHGLKSWLLDRNTNNALKIVGNKLVLLVGLPVFLWGFIFNAIPFFLIDSFSRKKLKDVAFRSTFFLALGLVFFPVVYLLELWAVSAFIPGFWLKLLFLISLPLAGKIAFRWYILFLKTWGRGRLLCLSLFSKSKLEKLKTQKERLYSMLESMIAV